MGEKKNTEAHFKNPCPYKKKSVYPGSDFENTFKKFIKKVKNVAKELFNNKFRKIAFYLYFF